MKKYYHLLFLAGFSFIAFHLGSCNDLKYGCDCEPSKTASKEVTVNPSNPEFTLSTYEYSGEFEADAACHADMTVEFRWADDVTAQYETRPPLYYEFQSLFGWFPANEGMETHHTENGAVIWKISISEAIDKSKPEGSSYGILVRWVGTGNETQEEKKGIVCKIHIKYKDYADEYYQTGC